MAKFQTPQKEKGKPARIVVIPPVLWAFDWKAKPAADVAIGLRLISERDVQIAKVHASKYMLKMYGTPGPDGSHGFPVRDQDAAWDCYNDAFLAHAVGRAACDPNDVDKQYFAYAEEETSRALTSEGLHRLWDEYCLIARGTGERRVMADHEIPTLANTLIVGAVGGLGQEAQREVRKHLAWVIDTLEAAGLLAAPEEEEGVYIVRAVEEQAAPI